jgi:hypothetical protein
MKIRKSNGDSALPCATPVSKVIVALCGSLGTKRDVLGAGSVLGHHLVMVSLEAPHMWARVVNKTPDRQTVKTVDSKVDGGRNMVDAFCPAVMMLHAQLPRQDPGALLGATFRRTTSTSAKTLRFRQEIVRQLTQEHALPSCCWTTNDWTAK